MTPCRMDRWMRRGRVYNYRATPQGADANGGIEQHKIVKTVLLSRTQSPRKGGICATCRNRCFGCVSSFYFFLGLDFLLCSRLSSLLRESIMTCGCVPGMDFDCALPITL
ncbi:hypothetical protein B0H19DRAFT_1378612 [Mycena capillaripes]|nr:hypothetical protein B0H19DRAFT_1378612 [Mycena capillaripes]